MKIISRKLVMAVKACFPAGTRVVLVKMDDPYSKLQPGDQGTVRSVDDTATVHVAWDRGSSLGVIYGVDQIRVLKE